MEEATDAYYVHRSEDAVEYLHVAVSPIGSVRIVRQGHRLRYDPHYARIRDDGENVLVGQQGANGDLSVSDKDGRPYVFVASDGALIQRSHATALRSELEERRFEPVTFSTIEAIIADLRRLVDEKNARATAEAAAEAEREALAIQERQRKQALNREEMSLRNALSHAENDLIENRKLLSCAERDVKHFQSVLEREYEKQKRYATLCHQMDAEREEKAKRFFWNLAWWRGNKLRQLRQECYELWAEAKANRERAANELEKVKKLAETLQQRLALGPKSIEYHEERLSAFMKANR